MFKHLIKYRLEQLALECNLLAMLVFESCGKIRFLGKFPTLIGELRGDYI